MTAQQDRLFRIACLIGSTISRDTEIRITEPDYYNYHHGQHDARLYAVTVPDDIVVGKLTFSVFENRPLITWIEVIPELQRAGIASRMIQKLTEEFPYKQVKWGYKTSEGVGLKRKLDKAHKELNRKKESA